MRSINVVFETEEFIELSNKKGELSWREFILKLADIEINEEKR